MDNYFDILPDELIEKIIYYVEDYDSSINLYDNYSHIKKLMNDTNLWKRIFRDRFDYLVDYMIRDFNIDARSLMYAYIFYQNPKTQDLRILYKRYNINKGSSCNK